MKKLLVVLLFLLCAFQDSLGAGKENWIGIFMTDSVPIKGCYVVENYGIFWYQSSFEYTQWENFKRDDNYINQFGYGIDSILSKIAENVHKFSPKANALIGADFKFVTNYEPLVSKNYYINGRRADGIGLGTVILVGNAVRVICNR